MLTLTRDNLDNPASESNPPQVYYLIVSTKWQEGAAPSNAELIRLLNRIQNSSLTLSWMPNSLLPNTEASVVEAPIKKLQKLEEEFTIRGKDEVFPFLNQNPFLVDLLLEAREEINNYFERSPLFLEFFVDPEAPEFKKLIIFIGTRLKVKDARQCLKELRKAWWNNFSSKVQGKLSLNLEYR